MSSLEGLSPEASEYYRQISEKSQKLIDIRGFMTSDMDNYLK